MRERGGGREIERDRKIVRDVFIQAWCDQHRPMTLCSNVINTIGGKRTLVLKSQKRELEISAIRPETRVCCTSVPLSHLEVLGPLIGFEVRDIEFVSTRVRLPLSGSNLWYLTSPKYRHSLFAA
eukprot:sb/3475730/